MRYIIGSCVLTLFIACAAMAQPIDPKAEAPAPPELPKFELPGIKVSPLKEDVTEIALPAAAGEAKVGGGGRFIVIQIPEHRKLALFDVNEAKITKYLSLSEENAKFAAGLDRVLVANPTAGALQRFSLITFEKELTGRLPGTGNVNSVLMGSATKGPVFIGGSAGSFFLDATTLREVQHTWLDRAGRSERAPFDFNTYAPTLRMSANGRVMTAWNTNLSPGGLRSFKIDSTRKITQHYQHETVGYNYPSADGQMLYTAGQIFTSETKPVTEKKARHGSMVWYLPSAQGSYYLSLNEVPKDISKSGLTLSVYMQGQDQPIVVLANLEGLEGLVDWLRGSTLSWDEHIFYVPDAQLLAIITSTKQKLILHRLDLEKKLEASGIDYLLVTSAPPLEFKPVSAVTYQMTAKAKKSPATFKLDDGPPGMTVTPSGLLKWNVPGSFKEPEVSVIVTVADAAGQEIFHTFRMTNASAVASPGMAKPDPGNKNKQPSRPPSKSAKDRKE